MFVISYPSIIGATIASLRAAKDLNQNEFAKLIGMSQSGLSRMELGYGLTLQNLHLVCKSLEREMNELFREADDARKALLLQGYEVVDDLNSSVEGKIHMTKPRDIQLLINVAKSNAQKSA